MNEKWQAITGVCMKDMATVQEVLAYIEKESGLRLIAYNPEEDTIVYGDDLIDELVAQNEG